MNYFTPSISVLILLLSFVKCDELDYKTLQALLENNLTEAGSHVVINLCPDLLRTYDSTSMSWVNINFTFELEHFPCPLFSMSARGDNSC